MTKPVSVLNKIIIYIGSLSVLVPFIFLLARRRAVWEYNYWFFIYVLNHFLSELLTFTLALFRMRNLEVGLTESLIEGCLLILLYQTAFKSPKLKRMITGLLFLYIIGFVSIYFLIDRKLYIPSYTYSFHEVIMLIPVILYFSERMRLMDDVFIVDNPMFWISSGFLLFYSVSIFYFSLNNYLFWHYREIQVKGIWINDVMLLSMNILMTKGIWKIPKA